MGYLSVHAAPSSSTVTTDFTFSLSTQLEHGRWCVPDSVPGGLKMLYQPGAADTCPVAFKAGKRWQFPQALAGYRTQPMLMHSNAMVSLVEWAACTLRYLWNKLVDDPGTACQCNMAPWPPPLFLQHLLHACSRSSCPKTICASWLSLHAAYTVCTHTPPTSTRTS